VTDGALSYRHRPKATSGEIGFRIDGDGLAVETVNKRHRLPLDQARRILLTFELGPLGRRIFRLTLRLRDGRKVSLTNVTWHGFGDTTRLDEAYRTFASALIAAAAGASPDCRLEGGRSRPVWFAMVAVVGFTLIGLAVFVGRALVLGAPGAAAVGLAVLALTAWQITPLVVRNRPRSFTPDAIPADLMP
jgi:hypothetical protein